MRVFGLFLILITVVFSSEDIQEKKSILGLDKEIFYSMGLNMERGVFKNTLKNTSGIFDGVTLNNSSQEKVGKGLELDLGVDIDSLRVGGFYNQIDWSNASSKTVGLFLKRELERVRIADMSLDTLAQLKVGTTELSLDGFSGKSDTSYSLSAGVKYHNTLITFGYNFFDIDVSKKYAIGGSATHSVNYSGGLFLGVCYEGVFK